MRPHCTLARDDSSSTLRDAATAALATLDELLRVRPQAFPTGSQASKLLLPARLQLAAGLAGLEVRP